MSNHNRASFRDHKAGMTALLLEWSDGGISGGVYHRQNGLTGIESNLGRSVEEAKAYLDHKSGCLQPCSCPPWYSNS